MKGVESVLLYYKLVGRVRVALDGVNVTVGGDHAALEDHIRAVDSHPLLGGDIDFKLARSSGPLNQDAIRESNFDRLRVVTCKEVVSLKQADQCHPSVLPDLTGRHLEPTDWHQAIQSAREAPLQQPILLDTRNIYETSIGHFQADGCELIDPKLRHFSEFPAWLRSNAPALADRQVLMYCTGGVRCERASALVKSLGPEFQNVCQLQGGIQRYLEQFPDGGFFRGKNFVFDERVAVAPEQGNHGDVVGECLLCGSSCDDYGPRLRCTHCRLLVLVCKSCSDKVWSPLECELCQKRKQPPSSLPQSKKLRILCLHGFRSTGASMNNQNSSFFKAVADLAEFYFLDGPHKLPFLYKPSADKPHPKALPKIDASKPRRAWLVDPNQSLLDPEAKEHSWQVAPEDINEFQSRRQTAGWEATEQLIQEALDKAGPFDGILGLSQGAAVAAAFVARLETGRHQPHQGSPSLNGSNVEHEVCSEGQTRLRFAIIGSGYCLEVPSPACLAEIRLPAMHVFREHGDRQVASSQSKELYECFAPGSRHVFRHNKGHTLPADKISVRHVRSFLEQFL